MEAIDMMMRIKIVNLREIKKDHTELVNDFFKIVPFVVINDNLPVPGKLMLELEDPYAVCKHFHNIQSHFFINENTRWGYEFYDGTTLIFQNAEDFSILIKYLNDPEVTVAHKDSFLCINCHPFGAVKLAFFYAQSPIVLRCFPSGARTVTLVLMTSTT